MRTISFGIVDDRAVFMDERADSYFTLDPAAEDQLARLLRAGAPLEGDPALTEALDIAGEQVILHRADHPAPLRSLLEQRAPVRLGLADVIKVARLVRHTRTTLRTQPIESVLERVLPPAENHTINHSSGEGLIVAATRFLHARNLVAVERNCLLDSLSLLSWLKQHRAAVALVFGAKLDPFIAHCWVQSGDLVLNDRLETVAAFTPVRVIRCSETTP